MKSGRQIRWVAALLLVGAAWASVACNRTKVGVETGSGRVVDSFVPREQALRRFRRDLSPVSELHGSRPSRDSLVASFVRALSTRDTAALAAMAVTPAEFAFLYYPTTPQSLPPYDLEPGLMWHLLQQRSERGIRRDLELYGGRRLRLVSYDCGTGSSREGENTVVGPCTLQLRDSGGTLVSARLSQILERHSRFKVLSYANEL